MIKNHFQKAYVNELNDTIVKSYYRPDDQFYAYTDSILSEDQLGFRKGCSSQ